MSNDLLRQIQMAQRDAGERLAIANLHASLKTEEPRTYVDTAGGEKPERRRKDRAGEDPRIDHLLGGFDSIIHNAKDRGDRYDVGYMGAMRKALGALILDLTP